MAKCLLPHRKLSEESSTEGSVLMKFAHVWLALRSMEAVDIDPVAAQRVLNGTAGAHHGQAVIAGPSFSDMK